jgi:hypothetical protein
LGSKASYTIESWILIVLRVSVESVDPSGSTIAAIANRIQSWYQFATRDPAAAAPENQGGGNRPAILLTDEELVAPFEVSRMGPIRVSTWQAENIAMYTKIDAHEYWVLCAMLGLVQWRTLQLNSLMIPEDFIHGPTIHCLYGAHEERSQFSLLLEQGRVCKGCRDFYHCLGADRELLALVETVNTLLHRGKQTTRHKGLDT